jgi:hypothetical protein
MHTEIGCGLLDPHTVVAAMSDPHYIVAELTGLRPGHIDILSAHPRGKPTQMSPMGAADPRMGYVFVQ